MQQGKQLPIEKIAEVAALQDIGKGNTVIAREAGISRSTAFKYQELNDELRVSKKTQAVDRSWQILELADEIVAEKIEKASAKDAAIIGKIQTDRLLDLNDPRRAAANLTQVNGDMVLEFVGKE